MNTYAQLHHDCVCLSVLCSHTHSGGINTPFILVVYVLSPQSVTMSEDYWLIMMGVSNSLEWKECVQTKPGSKEGTAVS
jgi:hypothetical protein